MSQQPKLFDALDWERWHAPVRPPSDVQARVLASGEPAEWNNTQVYEGVSYPMLYLTKLEKGKLVTYLLPGSCQPAPGWLARASR